MKFLTSFFVFSMMLGVANAVSANTYTYIDTTGSMREIIADTPAQAITNALDRALDSGVMLMSKAPVVAGVSLHTYQYVAKDGTLRVIVAKNADEAITNALDRALDSGVMLVK